MNQLTISLLLIVPLLECGKPVDGRKFRECGDQSWKVYKNEMCFKLLDVAMTKMEGVAACSKEIEHSFEDPLLSVKGTGEQDFIAGWLFEEEYKEQNLWLSAHRLGNNEWAWDLDNGTISFLNWEKGSKPIPKDGENCLQMLWKDEDPNSDDPDTIGRWQPTSCFTKNLVVCQKPTVSSQWRGIQGDIAAIKEESKKMKQKFKQAQSKSQKLETELRKAKKGMETIQVENQQTKELLKEISVENQRLNQELQKVPVALNQTNQEVLNTQGQVLEAKGDIARIERNFLEQKQDLTNAKLDVNQTKEFIGVLNQESAQIKMDLGQTKNYTTKITAQVDQLKQDLVLSQINQTEQNTRIDVLQGQMITMNKSADQDRALITNMTSKLNNVSNLLLDHDQNLAKLTSEHNSTRREIVVINGKTGDLDKSLGNLTMKQQIMDKDLNETRDKVTKLQGQVNALEIQMNPLIFPKSCDTSKPSKESQKKQMTIYPEGSEKPGVEVICDFETDGGGWTTIQRRSSGPKYQFYLGWADYERGFGSADKNYWIGLKNIYQLTKDWDQELRIDLWDENGEFAYAKYRNFSISDASDFYRLSIEGYSGTAKDSISGSNSLNGMKFSTKDKDNDENPDRNCAVLEQGAWWYNNCAFSNLNGLYYEKGDSQSSGDGMFWYFWKQSWRSFRQVEMKVRKRKS